MKREQVLIELILTSFTLINGQASLDKFLSFILSHAKTGGGEEEGEGRERGRGREVLGTSW